jgi:hypothetical protein
MSAGAELEKDLAWRESELASLKLAAHSSNEHDVRGRAARRAYVAMLYAHYEGFCKFAFKTYLISVTQKLWPIENLSPPLQKLFMHKHISGIRSLPVLEFIPALEKIQSALKESSTLEYELPETSNLWPNVFNNYCHELGLKSHFIYEKRHFIGNLVAIRNKIAHGQELYVSDQTMKDLENSTWFVMIELSLCVVESLSEGRYLHL